jgi:hypothetical protein
MYNRLLSKLITNKKLYEKEKELANKTINEI